jgi:hypothetical protein
MKPRASHMRSGKRLRQLRQRGTAPSLTPRSAASKRHWQQELAGILEGYVDQSRSRRAFLTRLQPQETRVTYGVARAAGIEDQQLTLCALVVSRAPRIGWLRLWNQELFEGSR